jgi:hypothetical protein
MADHKLERQTILDPAVADLLTGMEQKQSFQQLSRKERQKKNKEHAKITARREQRATYDLPPAIRTQIKELADNNAVPASQIVTLALARLLIDINGGKVDLGDYKQPSRSPRYEWNLIFPESLIPEENRKKHQSKV